MSADRAESLPRSAIIPVKFPGYIESGDVHNTITMMFGGNMYENLRYDPTARWSPDPESFLGLRKRKNHCAPEYAPRARSPIGKKVERIWKRTGNAAFVVFWCVLIFSKFSLLRGSRTDDGGISVNRSGNNESDHLRHR